MAYLISYSFLFLLSPNYAFTFENIYTSPQVNKNNFQTAQENRSSNNATIYV